jgi:hypothetical protein
MHKNATKCNETLSKWCKNMHGASKIIDTFETYQRSRARSLGISSYRCHIGTRRDAIMVGDFRAVGQNVDPELSDGNAVPGERVAGGPPRADRGATPARDDTGGEEAEADPSDRVLDSLTAALALDCAPDSLASAGFPVTDGSCALSSKEKLVDIDI